MEDHDDMPESPPALSPDRTLALELVRVTEAAAMAAGHWVGRGAKDGAPMLLESHHDLDRTAGLPHPSEV